MRTAHDRLKETLRASRERQHSASRDGSAARQALRSRVPLDAPAGGGGRATAFTRPATSPRPAASSGGRGGNGGGGNVRSDPVMRNALSFLERMQDEAHARASRQAALQTATLAMYEAKIKATKKPKRRRPKTAAIMSVS